ncbi:MAG: response regulator [Opitutales bacterium]|nr:response regulator [Opitutales bacterium]
MERKNRIFFVDDEPYVLGAIRRSLRPYRKQWDMNFCDNAQTALGILENEDIDIIISDMRMPEMDGAELLKIVQSKHSEVVRFVLSGYSDKEQLVKTFNIAHQYISKPCDPDELRTRIEQTSWLLESMSSHQLKGFIGQTESLPTPPKLYRDLVDTIQGEACDVSEISRILESDPALVGKILKTVNSSCFGFGSRISNCEQAVAALGVETIRALILKEEVFSILSDSLSQMFDLEKWRSRSLKVARLSRSIFKDKNEDNSLADDAFIAGMLLNIGETILLTYNPYKYIILHDTYPQDSDKKFRAEEEIFGENHATVGAYLLQLWGFAYEVGEAVASHHSMDGLTYDLIGIREASTLADRLVAIEEANDPEAALFSIKDLNQISDIPEQELLSYTQY